MSIDPRIPLMGQQAQIPGPLEMYGSLMGLKARQQQMDQSAQEHQVSMAGAVQEMQGRQMQQAAAARKQQYESTIDQLMNDAMVDDGSGVSTFDRQKFQQGMVGQGLGHMYPAMAETLDKWDESALKLQKQKNELYAQTILGIHEHGDTPDGVLSAVAYLKKARLISDEESSTLVDGVSADPSPDGIKGLLDKVSAHIPEYRKLAEEAQKSKVSHTLRPGDQMRDSAGNLIASAPFAPKEPKLEKVEDYDAAGNPIYRWVQAGPDAVAPRQEPVQAPQRPIVLSPGAKAVDASGATIAEGNPVDRSPTIPRRVTPGSREAYFVAYAQKLGKSPNDLTLDEQSKALQGFARADDKPDKPEKPPEPVKKKVLPAGTATKLSEMDNSLNELSVLTKTLLPNGVRSGVKMTGASAAAGAITPNFVTDLTGIGTEAKQRQGVIDRVKQVIGKALEGGVLRKEDEIKYAKILPTIGDPEDVVDTKLKGLDAAIRDKKQLEVESLDDAGYDMSRYVARAARGAPTAPPATPKPTHRYNPKTGKVEPF